MPRSPEPARRKLLDAALRLFAERGISGSTMREIRIAAGQSNTAALQYHFRDRAGLLRALLERELPALVARRKELLAGSDDPWSVAAVFVLPFAEMATGSGHQKLVVRFLSQLLDDHSLTFQEILDLVGDTGTYKSYELFHQHFPAIPEPLLWERIAVATNSFVHAAALRAARTRHEQIVDDELFRRNLVDMFLGAITA
ncbi:TetR/AcrR family transcriptional regulator [Mycobacterium senriense]|nr:TetR family transcriptional regulator [Mycobacterium senriense]